MDNKGDGKINCFTFAKNLDIVIFGYEDNTIKVVDIKSNEEKRILSYNDKIILNKHIG